jgi:hypothetical protein
VVEQSSLDLRAGHRPHRPKPRRTQNLGAATGALNVSKRLNGAMGFAILGPPLLMIDVGRRGRSNDGARDAGSGRLNGCRYR